MSEDTAIRELDAVHQQALERQFAAVLQVPPQAHDYAIDDVVHYAPWLLSDEERS